MILCFDQFIFIIIPARIGIHSGSVVGGMVGTKIPHYSIFGDTVEIAGLMESRNAVKNLKKNQITKNH